MLWDWINYVCHFLNAKSTLWNFRTIEKSQHPNLYDSYDNKTQRQGSCHVMNDEGPLNGSFILRILVCDLQLNAVPFTFKCGKNFIFQYCCKNMYNVVTKNPTVSFVVLSKILRPADTPWHRNDVDGSCHHIDVNSTLLRLFVCPLGGVTWQSTIVRQLVTSTK